MADRRLLRARGAGAGAGLVVLLAAVFAASCGAAEEPDPGAGPATASTVVDGVTVRLTLDRAVVEPGATVHAIVTVRHLGREPLRWRAGGCELRGSVSAAALAARSDAAGDPPADVGDRRVAAFVAAVAGPGDAIGPSATVTTSTAAVGRSCQIDHGFAELTPGEELEERATWRAATAAGVPLAPGRYRVAAAVPRLADGAQLVPAEFRGERDVDPIEASIEVEVVAGGEPGRPTTSGADAIRTLVAATALDGWIRAGSIAPADGSLMFDGARWTVTVRLPTGGTAVGHVSADGGAVSELAISR